MAGAGQSRMDQGRPGRSWAKTCVHRLSSRGRHANAVIALVTLGALTLLAGCGKFFAKETGTTGTGTGTGGATGDYLYVANANTSLNSIAAFSIASGTVSKPSNSPYQQLEFPTTLAITPTNTFLYAGSPLSGIFSYTINSDGSLTAKSSPESASDGIVPVAMTVDPSGGWLIVMQSSGSQNVITIFQINASTGALTAQSTQVTLNGGSGRQLLFNPAGTVLYATLGAPISSVSNSGGVDFLNFDPTTGALTANGHLAPLTTANAAIGVAVNSDNTYLFVTETGTNGVRSLAIGTNNVLTEVSGSPYVTGLGAGAVLVDATGTYLYVANSTVNTISAFSIDPTTGILTTLGNPTTTGTSPVAMVEDSSGTYIAVVCAGGAPDLDIFSLGTTTPGVLGAFQQIATDGVTPAVSPSDATAIVASH